MSHLGPGKGTLRLLPILKEATAFFMLRPFASDVSGSTFPGCYPRCHFSLEMELFLLLLMPYSEET